MRTHMILLLTTVALLAGMQRCSADGPKDNIPDQVRQVPPVGIEVAEADRAELEGGLKELDQLIASLRKRRDTRTPRLLPDVEIFARAVRHGLQYRELYSERNVAEAKQVLAAGLLRAKQLTEGEAGWLTQKGLVVRGFRSKLDDTAQPYGLVIPESYTFEGKSRYRLDLWFHGRGERTSETLFIAQRMKQVGRVAPRDTIVLHPYGRYSNAFKFAGEVDVLEALEHANQNYRVDQNRVAVRGFSMGGAGCWQFAVHNSDLFFAANPGAGFSETPEFLKFFQKETLKPTWYEKQLWHLYDCTDWAANLNHLPTVAYSGELDIQKQAADIMEVALAKEYLHLTHLIGPKTKHAIHADSLKEIEARLDSLAERGRERMPRELHFVTWTLKYNRMHWLTVTGLASHWQKARVTAEILMGSEQEPTNHILIKSENVTSFRLNIAPGLSPFEPSRRLTIVIDGHPQVVPVGTDRSVDAEFHVANGRWQSGAADNEGLHKRHNLQGPVDDAFMGPFVVVRPTGTARHPAVEKWTHSELDHFVKHWRQQFRGDALVKDDTAITEQDIQTKNLILFGDPSSNQLIAKILDGLPIGWTDTKVKVGDASYDATQHAPILIYPNPLNQDRYVVLNSGFTYREFAYLNNARQVPKLPDWAIVDLRVPPDFLWPGKIVDADFFDEAWRIKPVP